MTRQFPPDQNNGTGLLCPMCQAEALIDRQCKRLCSQCGYVESCEDSFVPNQMNPLGESHSGTQ